VLRASHADCLDIHSKCILKCEMGVYELDVHRLFFFALKKLKDRRRCGVGLAKVANQAFDGCRNAQRDRRRVQRRMQTGSPKSARYRRVIYREFVIFAALDRCRNTLVILTIAVRPLTR
jgi:hypothetical protein